jgi:thioredoxin reductase
MDSERVDVIIVGGGPAGLSAALVLARARRRVAIFDEGQPRNAVSQAAHGFFTRDGTPPAELREMGREQLRAYPDVSFDAVRVVDAARTEGGFEVSTANGRRVRARKLVLATGLVDKLPAVVGMAELYGRGVFSCPYCDGWEVRDQPLAVYGQTDEAGELALELTVWSRDIALCTDAGSQLSDDCAARLVRNGLQLRHERISRLVGRDRLLESVVFETGPALPRRALFVHAEQREASNLAERLGSERWSPTSIEVERHGRAGVPGLFVIGDAARNVLQIAVAVAEGSEAAITINCELLREDLR